MVGAVVLLGLTDFYLNMRAATRMRVSVFVPLAGAFNTCIQNFQAMFVLDEYANMSGFASCMTLFGAALSLGGALMIQVQQGGEDPLTQIELSTARSSEHEEPDPLQSADSREALLGLDCCENNGALSIVVEEISASAAGKLDKN